MKKLSKSLALLLSAAMALSLAACTSNTPAAPSAEATPSAEPSAQAGVYTPGTYTAAAQGFGGEVTAEITVDANNVTNVVLTGADETPAIGGAALETLSATVKTANGGEFDGVSGATFTSDAVRTAVAAALAEARGEEPASSGAAAADGVYDVEVTGFHGPLKASVTITGGRIEAVEITENVETVGIGTKALAVMPDKIVEHQSVAVEAVSGATASSKAVVAAVTAALKEAGADMAQYSVVPELPKGPDQVIDADVVIVGAGGAGLAAAIEAKTQGADKVVVVEKMDITGGNTRMSGGEFAAPGNWVQLAEGIENDSVADFYEDVYKGGYELGNPDLIHILTDNALSSAEWLRDFVGVEYKDHQSWYGGHRVARTLWPVGDGPVYVDTLQAKAEELGVEIMFRTRAEELLTDDTGRVTGVVGHDREGAQVTLNAAKGVILTSGGFGANVEMRQQYNEQWPTLDESIPTTNSPAITGDGILMAQALGANTVDMGLIQLYPVNNPVTGNYYYIDYARLNSTALLLNKEGERFVNEKGTRDVISQATLEQTDSKVYELIDAGVVAEQKLYEDYQAEIDKCLKDGVLAIGTIEEVSEFFGLPAGEVQKSIDRYNGLVESGVDTDFGRTDNFNKIGEGPYFMFPSVVSVHHTMGGLEIDASARVISTDGAPIPGLYAAGEITGGIHGGNRLGSDAVCDTVVFGRLAAQSCVAGK